MFLFCHPNKRRIFFFEIQTYLLGALYSVQFSIHSENFFFVDVKLPLKTHIRLLTYYPQVVHLNQ